MTTLLDKINGKLHFLSRRLLNYLASRYVEIQDDRAKPSPRLKMIAPKQTVNPDFGNYRYYGRRPYWMDFRSIELDPVFTFTVGDAEILRGGIVIEPGNKLVLESTIFQTEYLERLGASPLLLARRALPAQQVGRVISLANFLDTNYFHWVTESLTRLAVLEEEALSEYQVLIRADAPRFQKDSLRYLLGIEDHQVIEQKRIRARSDKCLIVSFPHTRNEQTQWTNVYRYSALRRLHELALRQLRAEPGPRQNLIISRAQSPDRRILNEERILECFPSLGFRIVRPETLSYEEQVRLFSEANIVIAVHGAALTNVLFARSPLVIEFFPETRNIRDAFYFCQISLALGFRHHVIEYTPDNPAQDLRLNDAHLEQLSRILTESGRLGES